VGRDIKRSLPSNGMLMGGVVILCVIATTPQKGIQMADESINCDILYYKVLQHMICNGHYGDDDDDDNDNDDDDDDVKKAISNCHSTERQ